MILDLLHIPLAVAACFALWKLWTLLAGRGRASLIIALGFLIRAFGGEVLFWISYLNLPVARSLQLGDGFWFFAVDGPGMLAYTGELILGGPMAILLIGRELPSHAFIQVFTAFAWMLGTFASVAILLNCAAFLATCAVILRLGEPDASSERTRLVALAAMAFGPGTILWSLQLLKDTFFIFLIAAMIACCFSWQELWRGELTNWKRKAVTAGAMLAILYAMAGIRWYFALFFWGAWSIFGLLITLAARRKLAAIVANVILFVFLAQVVRLGGASDVPQSIRRVLDPRPSVAATFRPTFLTKDIAGRRYGFEKTPGATTIIAGRALETDNRHSDETTKQKPAKIALPVPPSGQLVPPGQPVPSAQLVPSGQPVPSAQPVPSGQLMPPAQSVPSVQLEPPAQSVPSAQSAPSTQLVPSAQPTPSTQQTPSASTQLVPSTQPAPPAQVVTSAQRVPYAQPTPSAQLAPRVQLALDADKTIEPHPVAKTVAGLSAEFVPRSIAQALGLVRIGGGRGFWLFAELDTLVLDALLIFSIIVCARSIRTHRRVTPLFVLLLIVFLATAGPLAYTVNNFGTLFRLREMLYAILAFLPLTLRTR